MQLLDKILPRHISSALSRVDIAFLQEIRLRITNPAMLLFNGKKCFLGDGGCCVNCQNALVVKKSDIEHILLNACEYSLHAYAEQMTQGFIMLSGGVRLGVCGTAVSNNGKIVSFKDVSSVNIRIPKEARGCSLPYATELLCPLKNVLIVSRPGGGKTTFLRDLVFQSSFVKDAPNVLLADERNEIAGSDCGVAQFNLGHMCDTISLTSKRFAFESGLRTMTPDIFACDEIVSEDVGLLKYACNCGVKLFATIHADGTEDLRKKTEFESLKTIFERFVVLSARNRPGEVQGVFDADMRGVLQ